MCTLACARPPTLAADRALVDEQVPDGVPLWPRAPKPTASKL
jgi:hypothetical protein